MLTHFIFEKNISLSSMFPDGTESYNWDKDSNEKADSTVKAIESKGNKVYEEKPILSITIDGNAAKEIRDYNKDAEESGSYSNMTLM